MSPSPLARTAAAVDVSVIVVTFNNEAIIETCMRAVMQSVKAYVAEILVVDNASADNTVERVRSTTHEAQIIELDRNVGFAAANNVALQRAGGRYVALVNSDAFPDPAAVDHLIRRADNDARIGLVGGKLRYASGRQQPSAGRFPSLLGNLGIALFLHRLPLVSRLPFSLFANPVHYGDARRVDWVSAAFCLARRQVGPLPAAGFMYGEDVEWAHQATVRGFATWIEPSATAVHLVAGSSGSVSSAQLRQVRRVEFDLRWFRVRGPWAVTCARVVMAIHAVVRIGLYLAILPVQPGRARTGIAEFYTLLRGAARRSAGLD
jgi:N-acetylglucosaminyl-diphospho-decaprenol L-rhamnosyltransferase